MSDTPSLVTRRELFLAAGACTAALIASAAACTATSLTPVPSHAKKLGVAQELAADIPLDPAIAGGAADGAQAKGQQGAPLGLEDLPWNLQLINGEHRLPEGYKAPERKHLPEDGQSVDARIYDDLVALLDAAEKDGVRPVVCSSYRTHERQTQLHERRIKKCLNEGMSQEEAEREASFWVAPPGASEHEAAIAVDLVDEDYQQLDKKQEKTKTQKWLMEHCAEHGFILRYPTSKSQVTGIGYEPWHYRYVGTRYAQAIADSGLCLEEWLQQYLSQGDSQPAS